jgi:glycosyltransferase involved in cell wall biosynthesis
MGLHSRTFEQLVKDVKTLLENEQLRKEMGENARRYVEKNHDITKIVKQHVEVLNKLAGLR